MKSICVFCASSDSIDKDYFIEAENLGKLIVHEGYTLIFGGTTVGLMHHINITVKNNGGKSVGIVPELIKNKGISATMVDELIVVKDMNERKSMMANKSDAFVILPGGFGTLDEAFEIITKKQLGYHNKPIVFINTNQFYDGLFDYLEMLYAKKFAKELYRKLFVKISTANEAIAYIKNYKPDILEDKWTNK